MATSGREYLGRWLVPSAGGCIAQHGVPAASRLHSQAWLAPDPLQARQTRRPARSLRDDEVALRRRPTTRQGTAQGTAETEKACRPSGPSPRRVCSPVGSAQARAVRRSSGSTTSCCASSRRSLRRERPDARSLTAPHGQRRSPALGSPGAAAQASRGSCEDAGLRRSSEASSCRWPTAARTRPFRVSRTSRCPKFSATTRPDVSPDRAAVRRRWRAVHSGPGLPRRHDRLPERAEQARRLKTQAPVSQGLSQDGP